MQRIVVRHQSGSKVNQVEEFPLNHFTEIIFGRDPSATVKYDPDRDDLVGRQHAKIAPDPNDTSQFMVTDLNSRNGTYVNKQRIASATRIVPGDLIQLGPGGPEFQFDLEPRSMSTVKSTRSADSGSAAPTVPSTRQVDLGTPATRSVSLSAPGSSTSSAGTVGKATVERMISQNIAITKRTEGRKYMMTGGAILAVLVLAFGAVAVYLYLKSNQMKSAIDTTAANAPMDSAGVAKAGRSTVVEIDVAWNLISPKGGLVYHEYNSTTGFLYVQLPGRIEPKLTYNENFSYNKKSIGGNFNASGVVVSNDGFILTSHHVAAAWETPYDIPEYAQRGTLVDPNGMPLRTIRNVKEEREFSEWIPSETKQEIYSLDKKKSRIPEGRFSGRNDRLLVSFPGSVEANNARQVKASDDYDVAMVKVDLPGTLPKAELHDNLDSVKQGDSVFVIGYPFSSLSVSSSKREIPEPSISAGNIGKIIRTRDAALKRQQAYSKIGDAYQLTVNSTDEGYDGAPVFDDRARVIGIFNVTKSSLDSTITVAVPIKYAVELMSVAPSK